MSGEPVANWGTLRCGLPGTDGLPCKRMMRKARNCRRTYSPHFGFEFLPSIVRCPWSQIPPEVWEILRWWDDWQSLRCVVPWGSDPCRWPALVYEAIKLCAVESAQAQSEAAERRERQCQKQSKK